MGGGLKLRFLGFWVLFPVSLWFSGIAGGSSPDVMSHSPADLCDFRHYLLWKETLHLNLSSHSGLPQFYCETWAGSFFFLRLPFPI